MAENEGKPYDPYGFSEIESIQREIEQDLSAALPKEVKAEETAEARPEEISAAPEASDNPPAEETADVTPAERQTFYHETIKHDEPGRGKSMRSWRRAVAALLIVCTLGTGTLGFGIGGAIAFMQNRSVRSIEVNQNGENPDAVLSVVSSRTVFSGEGTGTLRDVINLAEPSVVGVASTFAASSGENVFGMPQQSAPAEASGIIFAEDAEKVYIATNSHVISGASEVSVTFLGGTPVSASKVGNDADADLAVISVDKSDLAEAGVSEISIAVFGDSNEMEMGDMVLAIGNVFGEGNSATQGIVSAKEKTIPLENRQLTVLQTDAAINLGNSGGPLINTRGEVIGINTAKLSSDLFSLYPVEGVGYSISSNVAKPILEGLINSAGPKPILGITGGTMTEEIASQFNIPAIGVFVSSVNQGSGAEKAGIVRTDIITSFNGSAVFTIDQLIAEVQKCSIGDTVEVKIIRDGTTSITLKVKLGEDTQNNF
ncbi:MAG: trypsin-like peptidase domain-containing protein [Clostridiales bacterium]|jgi:serine protease Do|nr:trypsin-like peptidase domain-containing protein [Clostridiales bacterium]